MSATYLNQTGVSLSVAAYLANDNYDHDDDPNTISATALIKPVRQLVLAERVPVQDQAIDVLAVLKSRMGSSIHEGIEQVWTTEKFKEAMRRLGYRDHIIDRIVVNPKGELPENAFPIYLEQRWNREMGPYKISGKVDFVAEGRLEDFKTTSTFTYSNQSNYTKHQLQGSIYRWIRPDLITQDHMAIQFLFTDFKPGFSNGDNYPSHPVMQQLIPLLPMTQTENYIRQKLAAVNEARQLPEPEVPRCTDEDLWRTAPQYKYYKNPEKTARSTKNFDDHGEAMAYKAKQGGIGIVITNPGQVKACHYCPAFSVCSQKDELIAEGSLKI